MQGLIIMSRDKSPNDPWLEVLAGRAKPTDHATGQAAKARDFYARLAAADQAQPVDEQRLKRLANLMDAQASKAQAASAATEQQRMAWPLRWLAWLFPPGGHNKARYAGVALTVLGLSVVVGNLMHNPDDDDTGFSKGLPAGIGDAQAPAAGSDPVVTGGQALSRAISLQAQLRQLGVVADVLPQDKGALLTADVAPDQQEAVRKALAQSGIAWRMAPQLRIQFK
jgi:hypothetical protein